VFYVSSARVKMRKVLKRSKKNNEMDFISISKAVLLFLFTSVFGCCFFFNYHFYFKEELAFQSNQLKLFIIINDPFYFKNKTHLINLKHVILFEIEQKRLDQY